MIWYDEFRGKHVARPMVPAPWNLHEYSWNSLLLVSSCVLNLLEVANDSSVQLISQARILKALFIFSRPSPLSWHGRVRTERMAAASVVTRFHFSRRSTWKVSFLAKFSLKRNHLHCYNIMKNLIVLCAKRRHKIMKRSTFPGIMIIFIKSLQYPSGLQDPPNLLAKKRGRV